MARHGYRKDLGTIALAWLLAGATTVVNAQTQEVQEERTGSPGMTDQALQSGSPFRTFRNSAIRFGKKPNRVRPLAGTGGNSLWRNWGFSLADQQKTAGPESSMESSFKLPGDEPCLP